MLYLACCLCVLVPGQAGRPQAAAAPEPRCGSYCLHLGLQALGIGPSSFEELEAKLGTAIPGGYSMDQLARVSEAYGAHTLAVRTTVEGLRHRPDAFACIALIQASRGPHFVNVYDITDTEVLIVDAPDAYAMPISTFRQVWDGTALLLGAQPLTREEDVKAPRGWSSLALGGLALASLAIVGGLALRRMARGVGVVVLAVAAAGPGCDSGAGFAPTEQVGATLSFEPPIHDLGRVVSGDPERSTVEARGELRNVGTRACGCTSVALGKTTLEPGERTAIVARIKVGNSSGPKRTKVTVTTDDPAQPQEVVHFTWIEVNRLSTQPDRIENLIVPPDRPTTTSIRVDSQGLDVCERCIVEATSDSGAVTCTVDQASLTAAAHRAAGSVTVPSSELAAIRLAIATEPGVLEGRAQVTIDVRCGGRQKASTGVPIHWTVDPVLRVQPMTASLGLVPVGSVRVVTLLLTSTSRTAFTVRGVRTISGAPIVAAGHGGEPAALQRVQVSFQVPSSTGPFRDVLGIATDCAGRPEVLVPVSGVVVERVAH
jgi:hypothetical protein